MNMPKDEVFNKANNRMITFKKLKMVVLESVFTRNILFYEILPIRLC